MESQARSVVIFGAGGHGKVVAEVARSIGRCVAVFVQEDPTAQGSGARRVLTWEQFVRGRASFEDAEVALAVGNNRDRERIGRMVEEAGFPLATLVHASAVVAQSATIGYGTVVMPLAAVNPDARVGPGCIVNTGAVVEHDCVLGGFVHLSPNAALGGRVTIGPRTLLGLGAVTLPGLQIGSDVVVGAGAVVRSNVADGVTVAGVPARPIAPRR